MRLVLYEKMYVNTLYQPLPPTDRFLSPLPKEICSVDTSAMYRTGPFQFVTEAIYRLQIQFEGGSILLFYLCKHLADG